MAVYRADTMSRRVLTIGRYSFIYARSFVTKDVPPLSIAAGIPAKVIGGMIHRAYGGEGELTPWFKPRAREKREG